MAEPNADLPVLSVDAGRRSALALLLALLLAVCVAAPVQAQAAPSAITITGVDLHDGMMLKSGSTYYLYGTQYGCGFQWAVKGTRWCGFGVATAPSPSGPWSAPTTLVRPTDRNPYGLTWQQTCGDPGWGCFNPRMIQRTGWGANDGAWILWFNAPDDYNRVHANAYWALGCNGPAGPCGPNAGPPFGSIGKPTMSQCYGNGDFSLVLDNPRPPMMLCTMPNQTLSSERISYWGSAGVGGGRANLAGMTNTEAPGAYRDSSGVWVMTFNDPNCGYCAGTPTAYATASSVDGVWTAPPNPSEIGAQPAIGRRGISATSCGGQARTVVTLNGQPYQYIDLWLGSRNETGAGIHLEPLIYRGQAPLGRPLRAFAPWTC